MSWFTSWADLFARPATSTVRPTTPKPPAEPGLYAAWFTYETTQGERHRLSCAHLHRTRADAERCGSSTIAQVERMRNDGNVIGASYVAARLLRNPCYQYDGVRKENDID